MDEAAQLAELIANQRGGVIDKHRFHRREFRRAWVRRLRAQFAILLVVAGVLGAAGSSLATHYLYGWPMEVPAWGVAVAMAAFLFTRAAPGLRAYQRDEKQWGETAYYHLYCAAGLRPRRQERVARNLVRCVGAEEPFVAYMRGFGLETFATGSVGSAHVGDSMQGDAVPLGRVVDDAIMRAFSGRLPVFGIGNPSDATPPVGLLGLHASNEDWIALAEILTRRAELLVLYVEGLSEGVLVEVELIQEFHRASRAIVIAANTAIRDRMANLGFQHLIVVDQDGLAAQALTRGLQSMAGAIAEI